MQPRCPHCGSFVKTTVARVGLAAGWSFIGAGFVCGLFLAWSFGFFRPASVVEHEPLIVIVKAEEMPPFRSVEEARAAYRNLYPQLKKRAK